MGWLRSIRIWQKSLLVQHKKDLARVSGKIFVSGIQNPKLYKKMENVEVVMMQKTLI